MDGEVAHSGGPEFKTQYFQKENLEDIPCPPGMDRAAGLFPVIPQYSQRGPQQRG
jgi:hypothetical protein